MEDLKSLEERAKQLKSEGKFLEALEVMEQSLAHGRTQFGPESEQVRRTCIQLCELCNIIATNYLQREDFQYALDLLKRAELLCEYDDQSKSRTFNNLACYYRKIGKVRIALTYLQKALKIDLEGPNTHLNMCAVLSQIQKHEEALQHAMQAVVFLQDSYIRSLKGDGNFTDQIPVLAIAYHNMGVELEYLKRVRYILDA